MIIKITNTYSREKNLYRSDIDFLKGIAIIGVIFYHIGIFPNGYLGVEIFLVISGYLVIPSFISKISDNSINLVRWFKRRFIRIWPITLVASTFALALGYFIMTPDSYENLSESVVASNLFAQNILSLITTRDYWNTANDYKPLMQMWYLGILAQFYICFSLFILLCSFIFKKWKSNLSLWIIIVSFIGFLSFIFYLLPLTPSNEKFYLLQYRIWEFCAGGVIGLILKNNTKFVSNPPRWNYNILLVIALCIILFCNFKNLNQINNINIIGSDVLSNIKMLPISYGNITCVVLTSIILLNPFRIAGFINLLGKMSLSLFVWHQFILAFIRYSVIDSFNILSILLYLIITLIVSYFSFKTLERIKLNKTINQIGFLVSVIAVTSLALIIYRNAGVVRDIPEMDIYLSNPQLNKNTEYIDQIYALDKPFETNKIHVLVIGNSFARDFASILKEWDKKGQFEISYSFDINKTDDERLQNADYIFFWGPKYWIPESKLTQIKNSDKIYGISTKNFGKDFGRFFVKRNTKDYLLQTLKPDKLLLETNLDWEKSWGKDHFINLVEIIENENGEIPIFTPNGKVISFDCQHLTQNGCIYYAEIIDFNKIFSKKP